jgi:hypothetical protein
MINNTRRNFIFKSTMLAASGVLTACGGGTGSSDPVAAGTDPAAAGQSDTLLAAAVQSGTPLANATILLSGSSVLRAAPYSMGYAFRRGDVPAGKTITGDKGTMQVIPKNVWPDGSLKFAVISGQADVSTTDTAVNLMVIPVAASAGKQLTTAKLRATEIVAEIGCGTYGTVNWTGADWDAPFQAWVEGSVMSSWIYRKPVGNDKHLVAWLEVRLWANGAVEVLPWIENGYLRVAAPTNKSATFTFTLGKTQRVSVAINLKHHQRTPLISGSALSYWLSTDPGVTARHNTAYLQATELVPTYSARVDANATAISRLPTTYSPLQAGSFIFDGDEMASSGYQDPIGLLPQHDVLYLTSDIKIAHASVIRNGFSAGRYALHYRDETTNRPLRFSSYPTLNIGDSQGFKDNGGSSTGSYTPTPTGGNGPGWDIAHSPSVGYLAYLVTGRWYFMEEVQFATTANYLGNGDGAALRNGSQGLVKPEPGAWQTRSCAWDWRARVQALCVTPDADTALRNEFIASVESNVTYFYNKYVAQTNNPWGFIKPGGFYDAGSREEAPWMQDFVTAAFGWSVSMDLPIDATKKTQLAAFFQWKAKSIVMRLGPRTGFWYINADAYTTVISPAANPDWDRGTGPWYATEAEVYYNTFHGSANYPTPPSWLGSTEGVLAGEYAAEYWPTAMWGNLQPAIAYAVRHNVPGAMDAYNRILGASNWPAIRDQFNVRPVWSVKPAGGQAVSLPVVVAPVAPAPTNPSAPAWAASAPLNAWMAIPGTAGAGGADADNYTGWAKLPNGKIVITLAGGHSDARDNRTVIIDTLANAPAWSVIGASTPTGSYVLDRDYQPDGKPTSSHTYYTTMWMPSINRVGRVNCAFASGGATLVFPHVDGFNLATNTWDPAGTHPNIPTGNTGVGYNPVLNKALLLGYYSASYFDLVTGVSTPITISGMPDMPQLTYAWDSSRNQMFGMCFGNGTGSGPSLGLVAAKIVGTTATPITIAASAARDQFIADAPLSVGIDYDAVNDYFLLYEGRNTKVGRVYKVKPNNTSTWTIELFSYGVGGVAPVVTADSGLNSKFSYVPELKGFVMMPSKTSNLYFMRTA